MPRFWALDRFNAPVRLVDGADPAQRERWLAAAYRDEFMAVQYADGGHGRPVITSSASQPSLVARMLGLLNVDSGHRVLEIGTGTGYHTALLCHWLGDRNVTSIDIDPGLVTEATGRLAAYGYRPLLVAGDGTAGVPEAAPYDRIVSTCASPDVPPAWIEQLTAGGVIVAPFTFGGALAVLAKTGPQTVCSRFDAEQAYFMPLRPADRPTPAGFLVDLPDEPPADTAQRGTTDIDPDALTDPDFSLWLSLHLPGARLAHSFCDDGRTHTGVIVYTATHRATINFGTRGQSCRISLDFTVYASSRP